MPTPLHHEPVQGELTCVSMLPVQEVWAGADEVVTLHCDVPFAIPPNWSITWMFAKDVSCTYMHKGILDINKNTGHGKQGLHAHSCALGIRTINRYRYYLYSRYVCYK